MKLYGWTAEHSLPRMALKGLPEDFPLYGKLLSAAELSIMDRDETGKPYIVFEVDADGLDDIFVIDGEWGWSLVEMAAEGAETEVEGEKAAEKIQERLDNLKDVAYMIDVADWVQSTEAIPPDRITVLGIVDEDELEKAIEEDAPVKFKAAPRPISAFKRPLVTRLLRSIFLPQPKLYGRASAQRAHRGPWMGVTAKPRPIVEEVHPELRTVGNVELVWAAGKKFRRGLRGRFGEDAGDAIGDLIVMRVGEEPGKLLGSGKMGAVYALKNRRALKITMDAGEISTSVNLVGVRHPNLAEVHDVFVVRADGQGVGIIVRDAIDTPLTSFSKETSAELDRILNSIMEGMQEPGTDEEERKMYVSFMDKAVSRISEQACIVDNDLLFDVLHAFEMLRHLGIYGFDFGADNFGVIREPSPRAVLFDYGLAMAPDVDVPTIRPWRERVPFGVMT